MYDFFDLVSNILTEEDAATNTGTKTVLQPWLNDILKKHNELFGTTINIDDLSTGNNIITALKASYASEQVALQNIEYIRLLDFFQQLYNQIKDKPTTWPEFVKAVNTDTFAEFGQKYLQSIKDLNQDSRIQWDVADAKIRKAWNQAQTAADKMAAVALSTYNASSVIDAVNKIVSRRIDTYTKVTKLKKFSAIAPFSNLITDVFTNPEQYASGAKKYPSDFEAADQFYFKDLIGVALAAKEFYATEITKLKLQQLETSSLQKSHNRFKDILNELSSAEIAAGGRRVYTPPTQQQQQQQQQNTQTSQQIDKNIQNKIYQEALNDTKNRISFLKGGRVQYEIVDGQGKSTGVIKTIDPSKYTVGNIRKIETTEAKTLIAALEKISMYVSKEKEGAGGRLQSAQQALAGIAGLGGVGDIYGGVR